jgi:phage tail-like protein
MAQLPAPLSDVQPLSSEHRYIADVVRIGFPVRAARSYLNRHLGNSVSIRLVEVGRGEEVGQVREAEVHSKDGRAIVRIQTRRLLPDGSVASFFAPRELVSVHTAIETDDGSPVYPLRSGDRIVLHVPVRSYLRFLPGIYRGSTPLARRDITRASERDQRQLSMKDESSQSRTGGSEADQFQRFLFIFQHMMTTVLDKIDHLPSLTNPLTIDAKFLPWLASWVNFHLDAALPLHQQRELVRRAIRLQRMRGTKAGVSEMVQILTSTPVRLIERQPPKACVVGRMTLAGGSTVEHRFHRREPTPCYLLSSNRQPMSFFVILLEPQRRFRERFGERAGNILRRISHIVSREMPANVVFTIQFSDQSTPGK